jgi:hypothetical protein
MVFLDAEGLLKILGGRGGTAIVAELIGAALARIERDEKIRRRGVDFDPEILLNISPSN